MDNIEVRGARTHNLKDINVDVPKHKLVSFTGVSGSGKSSLVFDTIYTEAQRQLIDTFSTFARRRLPQLSRPPVDSIKNIAPCIVIDQKRMGRSSRSTVGTATEIYTYMRMLFSRCGSPFIGWSHLFSFNHPEGMCPACKGLGKRITVDIDKLLDKSKSIADGAIQHPDYEIGKWYWREIMTSHVLPLDTPLEDFSTNDMDVLLWAEDHPISYEFRGKTYKRKFMGVARKLEQLHIEKDEDQLSGKKLEAYDRLFAKTTCPDCNGDRLNAAALRTELAGGWTISKLINMELAELDSVLEVLPQHKDYDQLRDVVQTLVDKMRGVLRHLIDIGVGYLTLNRNVSTLSGGESQRVKLGKQLNCDLVDMIYILDEPSVGLHPRDINHLIQILYNLRDKGNSVLVVEHDTSVIAASDWIVDIGPKAGRYGGNVLYSGTAQDIIDKDTPTAIALGDNAPVLPESRRTWVDTFKINNATKNNLKNVSAEIPKNVLSCLTGVAGSGKSTLMEVFLDTLKSDYADTEVVIIDQKPIGRSSRSNPTTYLGIFDAIRKIYAEANGMSPALFSFNSKGACAECKGLGYVEMELSFLDDIKLTCTSCQGKRYKEKVLQYKYKEKSIYDMLELSITEAIEFFTPLVSSDRKVNKIVKGLELLDEVGVGYLKLGQPLSTLSGGEAQRVKLASELKRKGNIYIMDEPTTGLHPSDVNRLMEIVNYLVEVGNTVIIVEHNLEVISQADWVVDLGPNGGRHGGQIVAIGTPEQIMKSKDSITGKYLKSFLEG